LTQPSNKEKLADDAESIYPTAKTRSPSRTWTTARQRLKENPYFIGIILVASLLRLLTMLGYRPGRVYWYDSYTYIHLALDLKPRESLQPSGYPIFLWFLRPFHSIEFVIAIQHALGIATGVLMYILLRRRSLPDWGAALATAPVLLVGEMLSLEHAVLGDTLFIFLVVAGFTALMWSPQLSIRAGAASGTFTALAALTRTIALALLLVVLAILAFQRIGVRTLIVTAAAAALPLVLYSAWYQEDYGRFRLTGGDGVALWARTMTFADCNKIKPPTAEMPLCPNGHTEDAASEYYWARDAPVNQMPGGPEKNDDLARSFAVRAIIAQPTDYLRSVFHDVSLTFHWTPARHPKRVTPAWGFKKGWWPAAAPREALAELRRYDHTADGTYYSVEPYAKIIRAYQYPGYMRGPYLAAILLTGLVAALRRRGALLPWSAAMTLLVAPVAALDFDHRYVLPVVPLACIAAALAFVRKPAAPASN
jgi:hypothetical protein